MSHLSMEAIKSSGFGNRLIAVVGSEVGRHETEILQFAQSIKSDKFRLFEWIYRSNRFIPMCKFVYSLGGQRFSYRSL